ncbi:MAG: 30S ribosomal protein S1 [Myxococcota bacterium]
MDKESSVDTSVSQPLSDQKLSFAQLLEQRYTADNVQEGRIVKAHVLSVGKDFVLVDVGYKSEGLIPVGQFAGLPGQLRVKQGDSIEVLIEAREDESGHIVLSKEKADHLKVWDELAHAHEQGEAVEGTVKCRVRGGLQVDVGVKAFLPGSQLELRPVRNLDEFVGKKLAFRIIKFNRKRGNVVLSRRVLLEKDREERKRQTLQLLKEGAVLDGVIKNLTEYGAFVDLGGIDGLLHVVDMSWGRVQNPADAFEVGQEVKVKVLRYDPEQEKVSLGIKQIEGDPWSGAQENFPIGKRVTGKVVSLTDYGAFIELDPGIEGLIHVSEMSWVKRVRHPSQVVQIGDTVEAVVLDIDTEHRRISLGMKQAAPNPWELLQEKYPVGTIIQGQVRSMKDFGLFIGIDKGIDGLVHVSDLSWTQRVKHPSELFSEGEEVKAVVLNIDAENERFSLGIKQLHEDPWARIPQDYPRGTTVKGKVTKVVDFGAFIEVEPGIDGLCHVSEFTEERVEDPRAVVKVEDEVEVMVIDVDPKERRISLSVKAARKAKDGEDYRAYLAKSNQPESDESRSVSTLGDALKSKLSSRKGASAASDKQSSGSDESA